MTWWTYLNYICAGRRAPSQEQAIGPVVAPGVMLKATDRHYQVDRWGTWHRVGPKQRGLRLARKSQIRLLPKPSHNKY